MLGGLIIALVIGAIAGWLAGEIVKGHGQGLIVNIVVGIIGAVIASFLFPYFGLFARADGTTPIIASIIYSTIGAIILLLVIRLVNRAS